MRLGCIESGAVAETITMATFRSFPLFNCEAADANHDGQAAIEDLRYLLGNTAMMALHLDAVADAAPTASG